MIGILSVLLIAGSSVPLAQDSASMSAGRLCERALDNAAPIGRPQLAAALQMAEAGRQGARTAFLRGCQRFAEGKAGKATDEFERAVKQEGANPVYHLWLARALGEQAQDANPLRQPGLARRTKSELERASALAPAYLDARDGLVEFYLQAPGIVGGSVSKARAQAAEMKRIDPYRGELAALKVAQRSNDTGAVIRGYETLIESFPDSAGPYSALAVTYAARRQWADGWRTIDRWSGRTPDSYAARYAAGRMAAESGQRPDQGEKALREYLSHELKPGEPSLAAAHWRLGMILEKRGDRDGARREYELGQKLDPALKGPRDGLGRLK